MRFSTEIEFTGVPPFELPTTYRRSIASLLKESIKRSSPELYFEYWESKDHPRKMKDFTFSVYVPEAKIINKESKNVLSTSAKSIKLNISSFNQMFIINAYNALVNLRDYTSFDYPVKLGHYNLHKEKEFSGNSVILKTLSPVVVRKLEDKRAVGYLMHDDPEFCASLSREIHTMCSVFLPETGIPDLNEISVKPLKCKTVKITHYKEALDAAQGTFEICAPPNVLKLVYDAGLGARRSQGFGMMEVVSS